MPTFAFLVVLLAELTCRAAVAIRAPLSVWAVPSYQKLQQMVDISAATRDGCRAKNGLAAILQLRLSASEAMESATKARRRASAPLAPEDPATVSYLEHLKSGAKLVRITAPPHSPVRDGSSGADMSPELRSIEGFKAEYTSRPSTSSIGGIGVDGGHFIPGLNEIQQPGTDFASSSWLNSLVWQQPHHTHAHHSTHQSHGSGTSISIDMGMGVGLGGGIPGVDMDTSMALGLGPSQHELLDVLANVNGVGQRYTHH